MAQKDRSNKVPLRFDYASLYAMESQRFVLWLPVCLGLGIALYFGLNVEPDWRCAFLPFAPMIFIALGWARALGWGVLALSWVGVATTGGFAAAIVSAHVAHAPVIERVMGETVEGRVLAVSRARSGAPRLLLDELTIYGIQPSRTPERLRLTLLDERYDRVPHPGERIRVYASLLPTGRPVEPGGFDFSRRAFFERLGGIGLSRGYLLILPESGSKNLLDQGRIWLAKLRDSISLGLREKIPGPSGAFAAAIIVGDRVDINEEDAEALRASNLAHLLAISGLHMGILTGLVFVASRLVLAVPPSIALRWPTKKIAAIIALLAGAAYLGLSGATIATQRAFIMVSVAFIAVLLDRPAITLRSLALAATIVLLIRPISLLDAGFQMSFAATAALVAGFDALRGMRWELPKGGGLAGGIARGLAIYVGALLFSSLLAGIATAPISAFHFNRMAPYGLLANLMAVPVMGLWIAPFACLAAILAPLGAVQPALWVMGQGIDYVLWVAHWVAAIPGAVRPIAAGPPAVLGIMAVGALWLILWRGPWRFAGIAGVAVGMVVWQLAPPRPDVLIAPDARLIGVLTAGGRALDHATAQGFAAKTWLRRDGDGAVQEDAALRPAGFERTPGRLAVELPHGWRLAVHWQEKPDSAALKAQCATKTLLVARHGEPTSGPCRYIGARELASQGAVAVRLSEAGATVVHAEPDEIKRLWTRR